MDAIASASASTTVFKEGLAIASQLSVRLLEADRVVQARGRQDEFLARCKDVIGALSPLVQTRLPETLVAHQTQIKTDVSSYLRSSSDFMSKMQADPEGAAPLEQSYLAIRNQV